jgi:hypothetical protein
MNADFEQLDLVLGQQVAGLTALKNWLPRKIELIKNHKLEELEAFNRREEEQVARLTQAESQRQVLLGLLAREFGLTGAPTLSDLIAIAPPADAQKLTVRREHLIVLSAQIREGQTVAAELLRVSLDYVHYSQDVFAQLATAAPAAGYGGAGDAVAPSVASWLVNRTA